MSDGLACFRSLENIGIFHYPIKTAGRYKSLKFPIFDWLNTFIGNVKNKIVGSYHGVKHDQLPRYLGEFCFRLNRRFKLDRLLVSLIYHSANTEPIPEHILRLAEDWW